MLNYLLSYYTSKKTFHVVFFPAGPSMIQVLVFNRNWESRNLHLFLHQKSFQVHFILSRSEKNLLAAWWDHSEVTSVLVHCLKHPESYSLLYSKALDSIRSARSWPLRSYLKSVRGHCTSLSVFFCLFEYYWQASRQKWIYAQHLL